MQTPLQNISIPLPPAGFTLNRIPLPRNRQLHACTAYLNSHLSETSSFFNSFKQMNMQNFKQGNQGGGILQDFAKKEIQASGIYMSMDGFFQTPSSKQKKEKDWIGDEQIDNRIDISPISLKFIDEFVSVDLMNQINAIQTQVFSPGMRFLHATRDFKPSIHKQMLEVWNLFGEEGLSDLIKYGFITFRLKPDTQLVSQPCRLDPIQFRISCGWNQFHQCKFSVYDAETNTLQKDIWVMCVFPPKRDGRLTSPCARLITPYICNVILRAQLEQVTQQTTNTSLILEQETIRPPPPTADGAPGSANYVHFTQERVLGSLGLTTGGRVGGNPLTQMANGGASTLQGVSSDLSRMRSLIPATSQMGLDRRVQQLRDVNDILSRHGSSMNNQSLIKELLRKQLDAAMVILPPTPTEPHLIYQLQNGHSLHTLQPPDIPPCFEFLTKEYTQICFDVFALPNETMFQQRRLYADETQLLTTRLQLASLKYGVHIQNLFNRVLADIFGTASMFLYLKSQIDELMGLSVDDMLEETPEQVATQIEQPSKKDKEKEPKKGATTRSKAKSPEDKVSPKEDKESPESSTLNESWVQEMKDLTENAASGGRKLKKVEKLLLSLLTAHQMLDDMTSGEQSAELKQGSPLDGMQGESTTNKPEGAPGETNLDAHGSALSMAERLFNFNKKQKSDSFVMKGQLHKAYQESPKQMMARIESLVQYSEQSMENAAGVVVRLTFLENYEKQKMTQDFVDPQQAVQVVQTLIGNIQQLTQQLMVQDEELKRKSNKRKKPQRPSDVDQDLQPENIVKDTFTQGRNPRLMGLPDFDPMDIQQNTLQTTHKLLRLNPSPWQPDASNLRVKFDGSMFRGAPPG
jgi:hypothetical protein